MKTDVRTTGAAGIKRERTRDNRLCDIDDIANRLLNRMPSLDNTHHLSGLCWLQVVDILLHIDVLHLSKRIGIPDHPVDEICSLVVSQHAHILGRREICDVGHHIEIYLKIPIAVGTQHSDHGLALAKLIIAVARKVVRVGNIVRRQSIAVGQECLVLEQS